MDRVALAGWLILVLALAGYVIGIVAPYPGRSVTLPGLMAGIALAAIGSGSVSKPDSGTGANAAGSESP